MSKDAVDDAIVIGTIFPFALPVIVNEPVIVWLPIKLFEPVVATELVQIFNEDVNEFNWVIDDVTEPVNKYLKSNELVNCKEPLIVPAGMVVDELINPNAVICADELNKFEGNGWTLPLNVYLVSYEDVNWDEELIAPLNDVKNEPVSLSVIQLPLTLSIAFNLFTNDDVDCDAVYELNEDVVNLPFIPFVNAILVPSCEAVYEFNETNEIEELINPNDVICAEELIVPDVVIDAVYELKDDVDNLPSKLLLNAAVTKSVANVVSNEDVNWFIEILYVVLPDIPTTKVVSNDAGLNAGNSDIFLVCLSAIFL